MRQVPVGVSLVVAEVEMDPAVPSASVATAFRKRDGPPLI
jgi:hypothetical protein